MKIQHKLFDGDSECLKQPNICKQPVGDLKNTTDIHVQITVFTSRLTLLVLFINESFKEYCKGVKFRINLFFAKRWDAHIGEILPNVWSRYYPYGTLLRCKN